jgi:tetratricopeptide (TPR) repeat protein
MGLFILENNFSMKTYIKKIASLHERYQMNSATPTAIFGTAGTLRQNLKAQIQYRVAIWPTLYTEKPALGVGLMSAFAYLLESLNDVRVYILFVDTAKAHPQFDWRQAQFGIEDWQPQNLDENIAVAGVLSQDDKGWTWALEIENDLVNDDDPDSTFALSYSAPTFSGIVNQLPQVIHDLMSRLTPETIVMDAFTPTQTDDELLIKLLSNIGEWQVSLNRTLLDLPFIAGNIYESIDSLAILGASINDSFSHWLTASAIAYSLLSGYNNRAPEMMDAILSAIDTLSDFPFANIYIGNAVYNLGEAELGYKLLEQAVTHHPSSDLGWLFLADLYRRGGNVNKMIDTFQRAIEVEAANARLYRNYGTVLELLNDNNPLQEVILIDPTEYEDSLPLWEAISAYDEALQLEPDSITALQRRTMLLSDLANDVPQRFLDSFKQLLQADQTGEAVRAVLDQLHDLDDYEPLFDVLEASQEAQPNRIDLKVNLAVAYLAGEEYELAEEELDAVLEMTDKPTVLADVSRLLLTAENPEFESRLAELEAQSLGGATINVSDIDFLYQTIEKAPLLADVYTTLGRALHQRSESEEALEVLLAGYKNHPQDPELILQIGTVLWESEREEEALQYLNRGIKVNPNYVPLLATIGQFLFEDQQDDEARTFLSRAEALSPRDPVLAKARRNIADILAKR